MALPLGSFLGLPKTGAPGNLHEVFLSVAWLVVSNMAFIFHNIWDVILPIDELIFIRGIETNQISVPTKLAI